MGKTERGMVVLLKENKYKVREVRVFEGVAENSVCLRSEWRLGERGQEPDSRLLHSG